MRFYNGFMKIISAKQKNAPPPPTRCSRGLVVTSTDSITSKYAIWNSFASLRVALLSGLNHSLTIKHFLSTTVLSNYLTQAFSTFKPFEPDCTFLELFETP